MTPANIVPGVFALKMRQVNFFGTRRYELVMQRKCNSVYAHEKNFALFIVDASVTSISSLPVDTTSRAKPPLPRCPTLLRHKKLLRCHLRVLDIPILTPLPQLHQRQPLLLLLLSRPQYPARHSLQFDRRLRQTRHGHQIRQVILHRRLEQAKLPGKGRPLDDVLMIHQRHIRRQMKLSCPASRQIPTAATGLIRRVGAKISWESSLGPRRRRRIDRKVPRHFLRGVKRVPCARVAPSFPLFASVLGLFALDLGFATLWKRVLDPDHLLGAALAHLRLPCDSIVVIAFIVIIRQGYAGKLSVFFVLAVTVLNMLLLLLLLLRRLAISIEIATIVNLLKRKA